jgi:putative DNA primase/helicase
MIDTSTQTRDTRHAADDAQADRWPEPELFSSDLPAVEPFDYEMLPDSMRAYVQDVANRMQVPPDGIAAAIVVAMGSVIGRQVGIMPKRCDDWLVVPNTYGGYVSRSADMKTPATAQALKPIKRLEVKARDEHKQAMDQFKITEMVAAARRDAAKDRIKKAVKDGVDPTAIAAEAMEDKPEPPARRRYVLNDTTVEKLGEVLAANPNGVMIFRDELVGFLRGLDKQGRESDRAFYLEAWNGNDRFTYDRIGRGTVEIESCTVSIFGNTTPGPLRAYVAGAMGNGDGADGLLQRFQLLVWPDPLPTWRNIDQWPDRAAKDRAAEAFVSIGSFVSGGLAEKLQASIDDDGIPYLRFDDDAQRLFDQWRRDLEHELRSISNHDAIVSHLSKFRSLIPTLALIFHVSDGLTGPVGRSSLQRAIKWDRYLWSHARRVYSLGDESAHVQARTLADKIIKGSINDGFTMRDVYRPQWSGLATKQEAEIAINELESRHWIRSETQDTGGKPTVVYCVNPKLFTGQTDKADITDKTPGDTPDSGDAGELTKLTELTEGDGPRAGPSDSGNGTDNRGAYETPDNDPENEGFVDADIDSEVGYI